MLQVCVVFCWHVKSIIPLLTILMLPYVDVGKEIISLFTRMSVEYGFVFGMFPVRISAATSTALKKVIMNCL